MEEKRSHPRISLQEIIKYADGVQAKSQDVSLSGIRFISGEQLKAGTPLNLYFLLENKNMVKTTGKIVWSRMKEPKVVENGFQFVSINKDGKKALSCYINRFLFMKTQEVLRQRMLIEVLVNYAIRGKTKPVSITEAGMSIFTATPLVEKKILLLSIPLPAGDTVSIHGKSMWYKQLKYDLFENKIEFWNIEESEKEKLFTFIKAG